MDIDGMVAKFMKAEKVKYDRLYQKSTSLKWKQDAYRDVSDKLIKYKDDHLNVLKPNSILRSGTFAKSTTTVKDSQGKDSEAISIISSTGARVGDYTISVDRLATKDLYKSTPNISAEIKGISASDVMSITGSGSFAVQYNGQTKTLSFSDSEIATLQSDPTTANQKFVDLLNTKLVSAFGSSGTVQRVQASIDSGGIVSIKSNVRDSVVSVLDISGSLTAASTKKIELPDGFDPTTDYYIDFQYNGSTERLTFKVGDTPEKTAENMQKAIQDELKAKGVAAADAEAFKVSIDENGKLKIEKPSSLEEATIVIKDLGTDPDAADPSTNVKLLSLPNGTAALRQKSLLTKLGLTNGMNNDVLSQTLGRAFGVTGNQMVTINGKSFSFNENTSISAFINTVNVLGAGVTMRYSLDTKEFTLESNQTGYRNAINFSSPSVLTTGFGFTSPSVAAASAVFTVNGIQMESDSNRTEIDSLKLSLSLNEVTAGELTISIKRDTENAYTVIKDFVDSYNSLIKDLNKVTSEKRMKNKGSYYQPLTEDERKDLSEKDIESWEKAAKSGILNNDSIVDGITRKMRSLLYEPFDLGGGRKIALYEIGITTANFKKGTKGELVIDDEKLKKALDERFDDVAKMFSHSSTIQFSNDSKDSAKMAQRTKENGLGFRLLDIAEGAVTRYGSLYEKAGIKDTASELTNTMYKELDKYANQMTDMLKYLARREDYYYSMFAKMESAMTKADSQMSSLMSQLGK